MYLASPRQRQAARDAPGAGSRDYHGNSANLRWRSRALILTRVNTLQKARGDFLFFYLCACSLEETWRQADNHVTKKKAIWVVSRQERRAMNKVIFGNSWNRFYFIIFLERKNRSDRTAAFLSEIISPHFCSLFPPDFTVGQPEHQRRKPHERRRRRRPPRSCASPLGVKSRAAGFYPAPDNRSSPGISTPPLRRWIQSGQTHRQQQD